MIWKKGTRNKTRKLLIRNRSISRILLMLRSCSFQLIDACESIESPFVTKWSFTICYEMPFSLSLFFPKKFNIEIMHATKQSQRSIQNWNLNNWMLSLTVNSSTSNQELKDQNKKNTEIELIYFVELLHSIPEYIKLNLKIYLYWNHEKIIFFRNKKWKIPFWYTANR